MRMKFGKRLQQQIQQSFPDWRDKFLAYKELKKLVKLISLAPSMLNKSSKTSEAEFLHLLDYEIEKFNTFFMEQEEDFIIHHKELQEKIKEVVDINGWGENANGSPALEMEDKMEKMRKAIVNFHGEMVLLLNYSNINYTGLSKILKKYDKRTGGVLRLPFIQKVLEQPFFTTDSISKLVKECEATIDAVFPPAKATGMFHSQAGNTAVLVAGEDIFRNTVAALLTMQEIRRGSSTHNHFSLPPLSLPDSKIIQSLIVLSPIQIPS